jgi:hypothetical protein
MPRPAIVAPTTVPSAPERPAPSPPEQVVSSPEQVATGRPTVTPWPPHRHAPGPTATMLFWVGVLALIVAGAVTAPGITAIALFCTAWLLRTLTFRDRRLARWRTQRGRRHNDGVTATVCLPWFGVLTLPAAVVNGGLAVLDGAIVVVLAIVAIDAGTLAPFLALGALVAALFVWWGPLSADVRSGGRIATGAMLKPGGTTVLVLFVLAALVIGLVTIRLAAGPDYDPLPHPPWEQSLRSLVS